jgi:hypothetical protein
MKYEFWMELPKALGSIIQDSLTKDEQNSIEIIDNSNKVFILNK